MEHKREISRGDYCFDYLKQEFPFVVGYILSNTIYDERKHNFTTEMVEYVMDSMGDSFEERADWMDQKSLNESLKKLKNMEIYLGTPPKFHESSNVDSYYEGVEIGEKHSDFFENLQELLEFDVHLLRKTFDGTLQDLISPWPSCLALHSISFCLLSFSNIKKKKKTNKYLDFGDPDFLTNWVTSVDAYYRRSDNSFSLPLSIIQKPFFSMDYPSALNFGALGSVIGQRISHGFTHAVEFV